jgi:hypothetical protein
VYREVSLCGGYSKGELHLAVGLWHTGGLQSQPLFPARVLAVMQRGHRLAGQKGLTVTDLAGCGKTREFQQRLPLRWRPVDTRHKAGHDDLL